MCTEPVGVEAWFWSRDCSGTVLKVPKFPESLILPQTSRATSQIPGSVSWTQFVFSKMGLKTATCLAESTCIQKLWAALQESDLPLPGSSFAVALGLDSFVGLPSPSLVARCLICSSGTLVPLSYLYFY